jgi:hypothetical protein
MNRAAKLATEARGCLHDEEAMKGVLSAGANRKITRGFFAARATRLGFASNKISDVVEQALKDAGATP